MTILTKKLFMLGTFSLLGLTFFAETNATSYCVASPVECTSYVHPLGFTGYTRPTFGEVYGLSEQNLRELTGGFTGVILVSSGAQSLNTVYGGLPYGPGTGNTSKDSISFAEFSALSESDIMFANGACDLMKLAFHSGSVYMLSNNSGILLPQKSGQFLCSATYYGYSSLASTTTNYSLYGGAPVGIYFFPFTNTNICGSGWNFFRSKFPTDENNGGSETEQYLSSPSTYLGWSSTPVYATWNGGSRAMCCRRQ